MWRKDSTPPSPIPSYSPLKPQRPWTFDVLQLSTPLLYKLKAISLRSTSTFIAPVSPSTTPKQYIVMSVANVSRRTSILTVTAAIVKQGLVGMIPQSKKPSIPLPIAVWELQGRENWLIFHPTQCLEVDMWYQHIPAITSNTIRKKRLKKWKNLPTNHRKTVLISNFLLKPNSCNRSRHKSRINWRKVANNHNNKRNPLLQFSKTF